MKPYYASILILAFGSLCLSDPARAGGYLWLGSETAGEGFVFRYDIDDGVVDMAIPVTPPPGASHWNNMGFDGTRLYLGTPTTDYVGFLNPYTGATMGSATYSPSLAGHKEDGAYRTSSGTLWRATFSNQIHEITTSSTLVRTFSVPATLVGLEWVGEDLYGADYSGGTIGGITLDEITNTATYTAIPWAPGGDPGSDWTCALAYDAADGDLYMAGFSSTNLYKVTFASGQATATLVTALSSVGYVAGGLVDGMSWVPPEPTGAGGTPSPEFGVRVAPNPFEGETSLQIDLARGANVDLTVFDATGRRIRIIRAGLLPAGVNTIRWDGRDDAGRRVAPGVYFHRVTAGAQHTSGKLVLIR